MNSRASAILTALALCLAGCVERKMTITSDPPGAVVYVSNVEVGRTPVTIPFLWYGDYDVILRLEGHNTLTTHAQINMPIYEYPPFDLLSEMAPWTYRDLRYLHYKLMPLTPPNEEDLIQRAQAMEKRNLEPVKR